MITVFVMYCVFMLQDDADRLGYVYSNNDENSQEHAKLDASTILLVYHSNTLPPTLRGAFLALLNNDVLHCVRTLVGLQEVVATPNWFTTFVAPAHLHCTPTLADTEDVPVRAGIPITVMR
jgi:hypothetical protein